MTPVAYTTKEELGYLLRQGIGFMYQSSKRSDAIALYASDKSEYVALTDEDISNMDYQDHAKFRFARAIEAEVLRRMRK